jgi:hypothetical protein
MVGADHSAVDHLERARDQPARVQSLQNLLPQSRQGPSADLTIDARPLAELLGKVTPRRTRPRDPENAIQNKTMVLGFAPVRGADAQDEAFVKRPFLVRHQVSCQAGLHRRYQLESHPARPVNPFCQHVLNAHLDNTTLILIIVVDFYRLGSTCRRRYAIPSSELRTV